MNNTLTYPNRKRLAGLGVSQFQEAGLLNLDFDYMQENGLAIHQIIPLDLSTARTEFKMMIRGTFLQVYNMTSGASLDISFNKAKEPVTFDGEQQWESPFWAIYITNAAQAGASCKLVVMIKGRFTPYYRTKAIAPTVTTASTTVAPVTVGVAAGLISAANGLRRSIILYNNGSDIIYIGKDNTVTAANGIPIPVGTERVISEPFYVGDIYGISPTAGQDLRVWSNFE
jgi:hypothetical protein